MKSAWKYDSGRVQFVGPRTSDSFGAGQQTVWFPEADQRGECQEAGDRDKGGQIGLVRADRTGNSWLVYRVYVRVCLFLSRSHLKLVAIESFRYPGGYPLFNYVSNRIIKHNSAMKCILKKKGNSLFVRVQKA